jgi:hypothetical protein
VKPARAAAKKKPAYIDDDEDDEGLSDIKGKGKAKAATSDDEPAVIPVKKARAPPKRKS